MSDGFVETTAEAAVGGYQGIKKVRGLFVDLKKIPPRFTESEYGEPKEQMEITLEDAAILEMFPNADDFELKDSKFTCWVPYAAEGKVPHGNSIYMRCFIASAEELGKKPSALKGEYITLERQDRLLFKTKVKNTDTEDMETVEVHSVNKAGMPSANSWCFVSDETADSGTVKDYVRDMLTGNMPPKYATPLTEKAALRALLTDPRSKQFPEFKESLKAGTIGDLLGVALEDGKYVATE